MDLTQTKQSLGVIARQWGDASCQRAVKAGKPALSLYWLWDCLWLNSPQPSLADKVTTGKVRSLMSCSQLAKRTECCVGRSCTCHCLQAGLREQQVCKYTAPQRSTSLSVRFLKLRHACAECKVTVSGIQVTR